MKRRLSKHQAKKTYVPYCIHCTQWAHANAVAEYIVEAALETIKLRPFTYCLNKKFLMSKEIEDFECEILCAAYLIAGEE